MLRWEYKMLEFKTCKLFEKTLKKYNKDKQVMSKFKEFIKLKEKDPSAAFNGVDQRMTFILSNYYEARLTFDIRLVYKIKGNICYLYGIFSHDELGSGQPMKITKLTQNRDKMDNSTFE